MNEHAGMKRETLPRILVLVLIRNSTSLVTFGPDDFFVRKSRLAYIEGAEAQAQRHHENDRVSLSWERETKSLSNSSCIHHHHC